MKKENAFSLIEVAFAVTVISFALVAILGLMPVGLKSVGEAGDATRTSMLAANTEAYIRTTVRATDFTLPITIRAVTIYYTQEGIQLSSSPGGFYRVDATIGNTWATALSNVDQTYLRPVSAVVRWPIDASGNPTTTNTTSFTFYVAKP